MAVNASYINELSATIIKANIKQYTQYKSRPLPLTQTLHPPPPPACGHMKPENRDIFES